jgi:hypothetical protein
MSNGSLSRDLALVPTERPAPRPSAALLASVEQPKPVRTRVPLRTLLLVGGAALAYPVYAFSQFPLRADLDALPGWWLAPVALMWLAGFVLPLMLALLPARGHVLPNEGRAGRAALAAAILLTAIGLVTIDAPGRTTLPASSWAGFSHWWWHCISFGLHIVIPALLAGTIALARVMLVGAARLGAAIGAAGGALSGLTLHGLCPIGGALHVTTAHGGAVVLGALLGALVFPLVRWLVGAVPFRR